MCRTEGVDQVSKDASGSGEDKPVRLHRYRGQHVKARTAGPAEDRIALIPGLQYRPQELNLYSEVDPLRENIPPLRGARALSYVAVHHKREMVTEIMPTAPALAYMELAQSIVDRHLVKKTLGRAPGSRAIESRHQAVCRGARLRPLRCDEA